MRSIPKTFLISSKNQFNLHKVLIIIILIPICIIVRAFMNVRLILLCKVTMHKLIPICKIKKMCRALLSHPCLNN